MEAGQKVKQVHFPSTGNWFDFYSGKLHKGGTQKSIIANPHHIPTFVRAGAIIPMVDPVQSTDFYNLNKFQLHYYLDNSMVTSNRSFYNDDGLLSNPIGKGQYERLNFSLKNKSKQIQLLFDSEQGTNYKASVKKIKIVLHNISTRPKRIKFNKTKINFKYNPKDKTLTTEVVWDSSKLSKMRIKL